MTLSIKIEGLGVQGLSLSFSSYCLRIRFLVKGLYEKVVRKRAKELLHENQVMTLSIKIEGLMGLSLSFFIVMPPQIFFGEGFYIKK